ncbi:LuxR C-terminal-related transcriptional regulator [Streptomyces coeruleorubidus]|uniref:Helix-turn-helix transcriptional regulator n=1 Tax=Streptomyces coeruleorubidus TaxID=116188 RepID=A0A5J6IFY7_STRC4|nr:LuxR C-terminal-related transcriptional regulator [Streptomyces coeruleorubidus]QEV30432.1 helix-turn-helix transcriptional regulator [Streptomyces coeruleorubidus]GGT66355.1 transcriptional regulator [Streptomyces coeruleorubidus]
MDAVAETDDNSRGPAVPIVPAVPYADPVGDPFLRTRFAFPARPDTFLRRQRLVDHLDQALRTPLTLIDGAAGAGKTLLAADWAGGLRPPVAWLTVEVGDRRPGVFWAYVLQALRACGASASDRIGTPADATEVDQKLLAALAAELNDRGRPVVLVLDEFERVTAPEVAEQLEFVLRHAGQGLRLVLVTRTEPLLPLHRYRAAGELTEIRAAELAFTPEEAVALLELHGLSLPVQAAGALVDRTRGWAAGLRLSALAARESADPELYLKEFEADHSTVADFLLAEVLKGQPEETQDLLLRVSVLDRFSPDLADALTLRSDAGPLLAGLHRDNAFVEHLGHSWYQLHPLFGEILRAHLRERLPGVEPELHRRAARWMRRSGFLPETLAHGAAAGDWEFTAGALVDDLAIGQLFNGLRSGDLTQLFSRMGPEARSPATDLVRAAYDLSRCDLDRGLPRLRRAREHLADDAPHLAAAQLSCALLEALAARLTGCPPRAESAAESAAELRREVPAQLLDKHPEIPALLLTHLGSARLWAGRFEDARAVLTTVVGTPGSAAIVLPREESMGHLALIDYLNGWPGRAERKALAAVSETERVGMSQSSGSGIERLVLAAVAVDRHELDRAQALLDEAPVPSGARDPVPSAGRALATARLLLARGRARAAVEAADPAVSAAVASPWAASHEALIASAAHLAQGRPDEAAEVLQGVSGDQPACVVEAAAIQLAAGRPETAVDLLDSIHTQGGTGPAVTVRAALVRAQAAERAGDTATARRLVAQALLDARRERLRRPFLDAGAWIRPLLATAPLDELAGGWLTPGPLRRGEQPVPETPPSPLVAVELSGRECDVLERLAGMMSTEEIAADLYVSVNTVKTHLKSVYRKLAVNRRSDAVRRARDLGLL